MLLGLDMLRRFQASIDLGKNALVIQGRSLRFLSEHELPAHARLLQSGTDNPIQQNNSISLHQLETIREQFLLARRINQRTYQPRNVT